MAPSDAPPSSTWTRFSLAEDRLLPALCPSCLEPGTCEIQVPSLPGASPSRALRALYCSTCAEQWERTRTRRLALFFAATLLGLFVGTSLLFLWETRFFALQLLLAGGAALLLPWLALTLQRSFTPALWLEQGGSALQLLAQRRRYAEHCSAGALVQAVPAPQLTRFPLLFLSPACLAVLWLVLLHSLGQAQVWVLSAEQDVLLLVDHRLHGPVIASLEETPHAGRRFRLFGGEHHFSLQRKNGRGGLELSASLRPGASYVLGVPPAGRCFFVDQRSYGQVNQAESRRPLEGPGPLYELPVPIDSWFLPLPERGGGSLSGGTRRALRLLPCSAQRH